MLTFASVDSIENNLSECLKKSSASFETINCTQKASTNCIAELSSITITKKELKNNYLLWNNYKNSVTTAILPHLNEAIGTMYHEFASSTIYEINKNRLIITNYLNNNTNYKRERYISKTLENCLNSKTDPTKCYSIESSKYKSEINSSLKYLQQNLSSKDYNALTKNQSDWEKYAQSTTALSANLNNLKKSQITKILLEERNSQLYLLRLCTENNKP